MGFGASGRNGGQVGSGQRQDQVWLERVAGREDARHLWEMAQDAKALVRDLSADMAGVDWHPGIAHACRTEAEVRDAHGYAEKLHRDYGYDAVEPLDRDGIRRLIGSRAYVGGEVDRGELIRLEAWKAGRTRREIPGEWFELGNPTNRRRGRG